MSGPPTALKFATGGLDDPRVMALLSSHVARARAETAPGRAHALDLDALKAPDVTFLSMWEQGELIGVGALKRLSTGHGEVKSMHVVEGARGRGAGRAMLERLVESARRDGMTRLSLETGSWAFFAPARAFYAFAGFVACEPFGDYRPDENSVFMTREL